MLAVHHKLREVAERCPRQEAALASRAAIFSSPLVGAADDQDVLDLASRVIVRRTPWRVSPRPPRTAGTLRMRRRNDLRHARAFVGARALTELVSEAEVRRNGVDGPVRAFAPTSTMSP